MSWKTWSGSSRASERRIEEGPEAEAPRQEPVPTFEVPIKDLPDFVAGQDLMVWASQGECLDRTAERPSELQIECLNGPDGTPPPLSAQRLTHGLARAALGVHGIARRFVEWLDMFQERPNTLEFLPKRDGPGGWGDPTQMFRHGYWTIESGQALVIDVPPIDAYYWNFQLNNIWEESLDYDWLQVTVNQHTAVYEPDGTARLIVADEDPGFANWIDTAHRRHGTMGLRYNQVVEDIPPTLRVMDVADLPSLR